MTKEKPFTQNLDFSRFAQPRNWGQTPLNFKKNSQSISDHGISIFSITKWHNSKLFTPEAFIIHSLSSLTKEFLINIFKVRSLNFGHILDLSCSY